jgi:hypothetical protein
MQYWTQVKQGNTRKKKSRVIPCWISLGQRGTGRSFSRVYPLSPVGIMPTALHSHLISKFVFTKGTAEEAWQTSKEAVIFRKWGSIKKTNYFHI